MRLISDVCRRVSVLVVEDHPDAADSLAELLDLTGYRVTVAGDGGAALAAAAADPPDVVLLDLRLPDQDGWAVARQMRARPGDGRRPLIVAVTGLGRADDQRRSDAAGVDLHLTKPVDPADLLAVLGRFARALTTCRPPAACGT